MIYTTTSKNLVDFYDQNIQVIDTITIFLNQLTQEFDHSYQISISQVLDSLIRY